jgi:FxsC-like protein
MDSLYAVGSGKAPTLQFVLSYARRDGRDAVQKFFEALCERLKRIRPDFDDPPGFMDANLEVGEDWPEVLAQGLRTAPLLVTLYSPSFFASPECGREVEVFLRRLEAASPGATLQAIHPVIWLRKNLAVHSVLADIQHDSVKFPKEYGQLDLDRLIRVRDYESRYIEFVDAFGDRLSDAIPRGGPVLPSAAPIQYRSTPSAWMRGGQAQATGTATAGPNTVQLAYIAASADELRNGQIRDTVDLYGGDPKDWRVFDPPVSRPVGLLAPAIIVSEGYYYEPLPFDEHLLERIRDAEKARKIVVLIVDSWAIRLPAYQKLLAQFESFNYRNCTVFVPLNSSDAETLATRDQLLLDLSRTFYVRSMTTKEAPFYRAPLGSYEEFDAQLRKVLAALKSTILNATPLSQTVSVPGF